MGAAAEKRAAAAAAATATVLRVDPASGIAPAFHPDGTVLWFRAFVAAGGLVLDPKVWRVDEGATEQLADFLAAVLARGIDADRAFSEFMHSDLGQRVLHDRCGTWQLAGDPAGERMLRMFIREINRAYKGVAAATRKASRG